MAQPLPPANVEARVGDVGGGSQVAVGSYILQIGSNEGGVVNVLQGQPNPPRPVGQPVRLRPRAFRGLLDRVPETEALVRALQSNECVECSGEPGSGKTSLLRHLSYHPQSETFPAGVIYFQVNRQSGADLLKSLFDAFYECDSPFKPTETQIRQYLQGVSALVLLDDVEITREQAEYLLNLVPNCTFVTATTERTLFGEAREVILKGLPTDEALLLFQREFGRPLSGEEQAYARALCESLGCNPRRILRAADAARAEGRLLLEVAGVAQAGTGPPPAQAPAADVVEALPEVERKTLCGLAVFYGAPVHAEHVAAVAGVQDAARALEELESRGLVQSHEGRYSLAGDVSVTLRQGTILTPWLERALTHFADWAELNRQRPKLIAEEAQPILLLIEWGVAAERWGEVQRLGRAAEEALALSGKWDMWAGALQSVRRAAQARGDKAGVAWALHQLGTRALCLGELSAAEAALNDALGMREALGDERGAEVTRHNLTILHAPPPTPSEQQGTKPGTTPTKLPPLLKLLVPALLLLAGGAIGLLYWRSQPAVKLPKIVALSVSPPTVAANAQAQLCYEVHDASGVRIEPGIGERKPATRECLTVTPQQTTVYTLTATGSDGRTTSQQVTLNVEAPAAPPSAEILSFTVQRRNGPGGATDLQFQLCYGVRNVDRVEIDNGVGVVAAAERRCLPVRPEQPTTYTLTATGSDGQAVRQQVVVDATRPPPPPAQILSFDASPARVAAGETAQLCYRLTGASGAQIDPGVGGVGVGIDRQCVNVNPRESVTYTLTALNPEGKEVTRKVTVAVTPPAPRVVSFTAVPDSVLAEGRVRLCYQTADASRVEISGGVGRVSPAERGCAEAVVRLETTTFTLTATGRDGRAATQAVTVSVSVPSPEISLRLSPESIEQGGTAQLCYRVANVKSYRLAPAVSRRVPSDSSAETCVPVQPQGTTSYTLTATGLNGQTVSTQATVNVREPASKHATITFFNAAPTRVKIGESVRLCYGVRDAQHAALTPLRRSVPVGPDECLQDSPKRTTTYTLIAVGQDREQERREVTVEVSSETRPDDGQPPPGRTAPRITRLEIKRRVLGAPQLCYAVENAGSASVQPDFGEVKLPGDCKNIRASEPRTYTLTASGPDGQTVSRSVDYTPPPPSRPPPIGILRFWTTTPTVDPGGSARVCYSTLGEGTAQIHPQPGAVNPSLRNCVTVNPRVTTVYTLTVTGPDGQKSSRQVTVNVRQPVLR